MSNFIFKIILGGERGSGKTCFLNGAPCHEDDFWYIGVSFKLIDCVINNRNRYTLQIWEFNARERYRFLFPSFCAGTKGAILCFDVSDPSSFQKLPYWVQLVRKNRKADIPITIVGTKCDLVQKIDDDEIQDFMEEYNINNLFFTSINRQDRKDEIFKNLITTIDPSVEIEEFHTEYPDELTPLKDKNFKNFLDAFSTCPICGGENHYNYLKKFYFSRSPKSVKLKKDLMRLIEQSLNNVYYNDIRLGIPCCNCYKKYFKENTV